MGAEDGEKTALVPLQERSIDFYGDQVLAVLVDVAGEHQVYVPLRPICDYLGLNPPSQIRRARRDAVMGKAIKGAVIMTFPSGERGGGPQTMTCLPLKYLPGWLFGITPAKVRPELRDKVIRYQEECFEVLWRAFQAEALTRQQAPASGSSLAQIRAVALAVAQLAEQQLTMEGRLDTMEARLDRAAEVVGALQRRIAPGAAITDEQAAEISGQVKALAEMLTAQDPSRNHYQGIFAEL